MRQLLITFSLLFGLLLFPLHAQSPGLPPVMPPAPDIFISQNAAATAFTTYKAWVESRLQDLWTETLTLQGAVGTTTGPPGPPGPIGPQGIAGPPGASSPPASAGLYVLPPQIVFPPTAVGQSSTAQFVIVINSAASAYTINTSSFTGPFTFGGLGNCPSPGPLAAGVTCTVSAKFMPVVVGQAVGFLTLTDSAPFSPQRVNLSGVGQ